MSQKGSIKDNLHNRRIQLIDSIQLKTNDLIDELEDRHVLSQFQLDSLRIHKPRQENVAKLLDWIGNKNENELQQFSDALEATDQSHIVQEYLYAEESEEDNRNKYDCLTGTAGTIAGTEYGPKELYDQKDDCPPRSPKTPLWMHGWEKDAQEGTTPRRRGISPSAFKYPDVDEELDNAKEQDLLVPGKHESSYQQGKPDRLWKCFYFLKTYYHWIIILILTILCIMTGGLFFLYSNKTCTDHHAYRTVIQEYPNGDTSFVCSSPHRGELLWGLTEEGGRVWQIAADDSIPGNVATVQTIMNVSGTFSTLVLQDNWLYDKEWSIHCEVAGDIASTMVPLLHERGKRSIQSQKTEFVVLNSEGTHLTRYAIVRPGEQLTIKIIFKSRIDHSNLYLKVNGEREKFNRNASSNEQKIQSLEKNIQVPAYESWLLIAVYNEVGNQQAVDSLLLEIGGKGPFTEEPTDQCGVELSSASFTCTFHESKRRPVYWYLISGDITIWVASDNTSYRTDLVKTSTQIKYGKKSSTLMLNGLIPSRRHHEVYCAMVGERSSQRASYYPPEILKNEVVLDVYNQQGVVLGNYTKISAGDIIHINVTSPAGNPKPGIDLYVNDEIIDTVALQPFCKEKMEESQLWCKYTVANDMSEVIVTAMIHHPKLSDRKSLLFFIRDDETYGTSMAKNTSMKGNTMQDSEQVKTSAAAPQTPSDQVKTSPATPQTPSDKVKNSPAARQTPSD